MSKDKSTKKNQEDEVFRFSLTCWLILFNKKRLM